jgi:hypothetical protein
MSAQPSAGSQAAVGPAPEPGAPCMPRVRVVYIGGDGRSGTTLLSRVLGAFQGCIAVGELYDIWDKTTQGYTLCSCGTPFLECAFWNAVRREAFGPAGPDAPQLAELRRSVQSMRHLPAMIFPRLRTAAYRERLRAYIDVIERLYLAIQRVSGCDVIVDSSKMAAYALALAESPRLDVSLVHMTRDSRACVFSWQRRKPEAAAQGRELFLRQRPVTQSACVWVLRNSILRAVARRFPISLTQRYEDLVAQPRNVVSQLADQLGLDRRRAAWTADDALVSSATNHIFAGNPDRVTHGEIRFRADDEWRTQMSALQQRIVTAITFPTLWQLGYLGRHPRGQHRLAPGRIAAPGKTR